MHQNFLTKVFDKELLVINPSTIVINQKLAVVSWQCKTNLLLKFLYSLLTILAPRCNIHHYFFGLKTRFVAGNTLE